MRGIFCEGKTKEWDAGYFFVKVRLKTQRVGGRVFSVKVRPKSGMQGIFCEGKTKEWDAGYFFVKVRLKSRMQGIFCEGKTKEWGAGYFLWR